MLTIFGGYLIRQSKGPQFRCHILQISFCHISFLIRNPKFFIRNSVENSKKIFILVLVRKTQKYENARINSFSSYIRQLQSLFFCITKCARIDARRRAHKRAQKDAFKAFNHHMGHVASDTIKFSAYTLYDKLICFASDFRA